MGVPSALGKQAHRHRRLDGTGARANEPIERTRLADLAGLSVAHAGIAALTVHEQENILPLVQGT